MTSVDPVADLADLAEGTMRLVRVDGERVVLVRTAGGVFALDHACPHEGYGLTQGVLKDGELTCAWHNWKFRVSDGRCLLGEEDVTAHDVALDGSAVHVRLNRPDPAARRPVLLDSLRRGIANDYVGQISRDVVRLLRASTDPGELVWEAVAFGAPRAEFGWGHAVASAVDCLAAAELHDGDERALPVVQAIAGITEVERNRPLRRPAEPAVDLPADARTAFRRAVEDEQLEVAEGLVRQALRDGATEGAMLGWFTDVVCDHHLSYGHGAIYVQKAFQLLEVIGWDRAETVLANLVPTIVYGTREDLLPYFRPFGKALADVDLAALADAEPTSDWDRGRLGDALLGADRRAPLVVSAESVRSGAGVDGLLDAVVDAVSTRLLRYDTSGEWDAHDDFGWLQVTHGLTYANAVRWLWRRNPSPDTARLALFAAFLAHWTGRHEWHTTVGEPVEPSAASGDLRSAVLDRDEAGAVALATELEPAEAGRQLRLASLGDRSGSFIVTAHLVKTARAAAEEAAATGSATPLAGAARFMAGPRLERFVAGNVSRSIDFLSGRVERE